MPYVRLAELLVAGHRLRSASGGVLDTRSLFPEHAAQKAMTPQGQSRQTWEQQLANAVLWTRVFGGKDLRPGAHPADEELPKEPLNSM